MVEQIDFPLQLPRMLKQESPGGAQQSLFQLVLCAGPRGQGWSHHAPVSGMELVMEELVEVMVLREGLMPQAGKVPVMAAVWETQAAGSMGRDGLTCGEDEESGTTCPAHCLAQ